MASANLKLAQIKLSIHNKDDTEWESVTLS